METVSLPSLTFESVCGRVFSVKVSVDTDCGFVDGNLNVSFNYETPDDIDLSESDQKHLADEVEKHVINAIRSLIEEKGEN